MHTTHQSLQCIIKLAKLQAAITRKFDGRLGGGLGLTDLIILYTLSQNAEEKMRRIDLAEAIGLTASGITRLLAPMEKIGLIKREKNAADARVSFVALASGGKRLLEERIEKAELLSEEVISPSLGKKIETLSDILDEIKKTGV